MPDSPLQHPVEAAHQVAAGRPGPIGRRWLGLIALACLLLFALDSYEVLTNLLLPFDLPVERWVQAFPWGPLVYPMELTNWLGGPRQTVLGLVVVAAFFAFGRRAGWLMLIGMLASVLDQLIKDSVARHRPSANLVEIANPALGYSYPSGHAVFFTWLSFMAAFALAPRLHPWLRRAVWVLAAAIALTAGLGRVWAGVHWPSDVLGGLALGLGWSAFVLWLPERWLPSPDAVWTRWRDRGRPLAG